MIHGGIPFKDLKVGQEFRFPAHPKPGQYRSQPYVKIAARRYVAAKNHPTHGHAWNAYEHTIESGSVRVDPGRTLTVSELAHCLRAIEETKKEAHASGGGARLTYQERKAA